MWTWWYTWYPGITDIFPAVQKLQCWHFLGWYLNWLTEPPFDNNLYYSLHFHANFFDLFWRLQEFEMLTWVVPPPPPPPRKQMWVLLGTCSSCLMLVFWGGRFVCMCVCASVYFQLILNVLKPFGLTRLTWEWSDCNSLWIQVRRQTEEACCVLAFCGGGERDGGGGGGGGGGGTGCLEEGEGEGQGCN